MYAVLLDQGAILQPFVGRMSSMAMFLHEFAHDARHMLGAPCH
jgi:cobalt transporter subunit CbtB